MDGYRDASHWLDETTSYRQVGDVVSRVLAFTASPVNWESLRYATSYYVAANVDVDVELSAAVPVSALQLLAYFRFVTDRGTYSHTRWEREKPKTEAAGDQRPSRAHPSASANRAHFCGGKCSGASASR